MTADRFAIWSAATGSKDRRRYRFVVMELLATGTAVEDLTAALAACRPDPTRVSR